MTLALEDVTICAGRAKLIHGVTLSIQPKRVTVVMGANGAGKSTALAALAGDRVPSVGRACLDGRSLTEWGTIDLARRRAVLTQHHPFDFPMQAYEVVALGRLPFGGDRDSDLEAIEGSLNLTQAIHLANRSYSTLSGGERQRVQIARALAQIWDRRSERQPAYLLLDEPTASLDLKHQILTLEICQSLARRNVGVFCILHDIRLAREFADEVVLLKSGRVAAHGTPADSLTPSLIADIFDINHARANAFA